PTAFFTKYLVEITETAPRNGGSGDRCGNGYFFTNSSLILSASCPLVASETTSGENKTAVSLKWTAPLCGCLTIRAVVVDSNNIGYRAQPGETVSNNPGRKSALHRVVCLKEKRSNARRGKKRNKSKKKKEWIDVDCCRVGNNQQSSVRQMGRLSHECDMRAKLHSVKKYFKLPSKQKSCRKAFKRCCIKNGKAQRRNQPRTRKQRRRRS
uniref:Reelin domain-containing protein n=1 Tax=Ciona savignyi TaxID=51511 RepID=H2YUE7_CIOSA